MLNVKKTFPVPQEILLFAYEKPVSYNYFVVDVTFTHIKLSGCGNSMFIVLIKSSVSESISHCSCIILISSSCMYPHH
jgi:hypothetical protein